MIPALPDSEGSDDAATPSFGRLAFGALMGRSDVRQASAQSDDAIHMPALSSKAGEAATVDARQVSSQLTAHQKRMHG